MSARLGSATRHYDEKLQQILETSARIFADKGFDKTSIRAIARATGMSLAGLYYYFRTKEELLCLIQEQCLLTLLDNWEKSADKKPARARIGLFVENHLGFFLHNMNEMKVMSHEDTSLTGEYQKRVLELKRRYVKVLMDLVEELQREEKVEKLDVRVAALSLFGMMNWIYTWYNAGRDLPLGALMEQMLRIYFFGVLRGGSVEDPLFNGPVDDDDEHFALWHTIR